MPQVINNYLSMEETNNFFNGRSSCSAILLTPPMAQAIFNLQAWQQDQIKNVLLNLQIPPKQSIPNRKKVRPRSKLFRALGKEEPPAEIQINDQSYHLLEIYKHDSWAATAIYQGSTEKVVCKFNRQQSIFGIPMHWLGRKLAQRENQFLQLFADLPNIPAYCGEVKVNDVVLAHATAHTYIEGTELRRYKEKVSDDFFSQLQQVLKRIHACNMAYMDLNKQENIIVTEQGEPCLIDFQIFFHLPQSWLGHSAPMRYLLRILQQSDHFHLMKHYTRLRPDLFTPQALLAAQQRPWFLNLYRCIQIPLRTFRRQLLVMLGFRNCSGQVTSEAFVEHGIREKVDHSSLERTFIITVANQQLQLKYYYDTQAVELMAMQPL